MSTSDQNGQGPLTRKQLREIRLTGSTPVISAEEAAAAADLVVPPVPPLPRVEESVREPEPTADDAHPVDDEQGDEPSPGASGAPLTRRQARAHERVRTASVPVIGSDETQTDVNADEPADQSSAPVEEAVIVDEADAPTPAVAEAEPVELEVIDEKAPEESSVVSGVPDFSRPVPAAVEEDENEGVDDVELGAPVSAASTTDSTGDVPLATVESEDRANDVAVLGLTSEDADPDDVLAEVDSTDDELEEGERPVVNPAFGVGVLRDPEEAQKPFTPSFDELLTVGDSTGSQHLAPSALIFTPSPGEGSLSGPVASTGEILVTGSYELPRGMGSQGHAHGTTDGRDVDAVLIDGELAPASSPTPIAASSAVSTIKPAGEVIRPPAPEKGNKLMLILAITAGGLALALGVVLIFAFTTNVF